MTVNDIKDKLEEIEQLAEEHQEKTKDALNPRKNGGYQ